MGLYHFCVLGLLFRCSIVNKLFYVKKLFSFSCCLLLYLSICAQEFGGNPPLLQWQQMNTPQVRIIFPTGLDSQAMEIASITMKLYAQQPSSIGNTLRKVSIVLQNQTLKSNGYVGLAPYRSEFFLAPSPNSFELGSLPWHQTLAIHEFRHVQQFSNFNRGWSKVFSILFGEQGQALANNVAVPNWFWEGDAVANETQVSDQGRGRLPFFFNGYAALIKEHRNYSWLKLRNGSFKDYVPNHYNLGYLMVAYGRQQYGNDFWKKITQDAVKFKSSFWGNPFREAIKKYAGINYKQYQTNAFHYFDSLNVAPRKLSTEMNQLTAKSVNHKHFQADYQYPYIVGKDSLLVLKNSYHSIPTFYIIDSTGEHRLRTMDIHLDDYYTYQNGKIIYASYKSDGRWGWRDKTRIAIMDITSGKQQYVGRLGRYFSPVMDESGQHIIAVALNNKGETVLNRINVHTHEIKIIPNASRLFFTYPVCIDQQHIVAAARLRNGKMAMVKVQLTDGSVAYLSPITNRIIAAPVITDSYIYFTASDVLADQQFAIRRQDGKIFKVTHDDISSYQPTVKNGKMVRTVFTATGYTLLHQTLDSTLYEPVDSATWASVNVHTLYPTITANQHNILADLDTSSSSYTVQPYQKGTGLFNFHSWRPFYNDPNYSLTLYGENILNTFQSQLAYIYNQNEQSHTVSFNALYGALFPYMNIGANYTFDRSGSYKNKLVQWNEAEANVGLSIPFNFSGGQHYTYLTMGSNYTLSKPDFKGAFKDSFDHRAFTYLNTTVSFSRQTQMAVQHINPRFAQSLSFNMSNAITNRKGYQWLVAANLYFPGLAKNHSLVLQGAYQEHDKDREIGFSNHFPFSRGYAVFNFDNMQKLGVNYHFPLCYPDFGIGGLVYFNRIRANLFYDYTRITHTFTSPSQTLSFDFKSTGAEIYFDTKWWNEFAITIGVQYSHLLDRDLFTGKDPNRWSVIWPTLLF